GRERLSAIKHEHFEEALKRIIEAPERQRRLSARQRSVGKRAGLDARVTFEDVAGVDDAIEELLEVKDYLAEPERFTELGAIPPRGILLTGPPGCGKTMLAKAVAGEANASFLSASGSEFVQIWVGQGAARVRDLFAEAKSMAPAILFIDEIDSLGSARMGYSGDGGGGGREYGQTVNQLLTELDGFEPRDGVLLMGATNRPDMLDPALLRPGRFDRSVQVTLPDLAGRRDILALYAKGKRFADDVDLDKFAGVTGGFSGADLANIVNEAALLAGRQRLKEITMPMMDEALDRVMMGVASRKTILTEEEKLAVAYHEGGHALIGLALPGVTVPHRVTIVPRGGALGYVLTADEEELKTHSRTRLINQMAMGLAGRAAEKLVFNQVNSGARTDLRGVNRMARTMVCRLGMGEETGGMTFTDSYGWWDDDNLSAYSEEEKRLIFKEVRRIVDEAEGKARQVMIERRETLDRIVEALLERETLSSDELREIAGFPREPDEVASDNGADGARGNGRTRKSGARAGSST
ncbi:MAG: AAA family ATPase, partial [Actinomycetota bacterium]|nr:AAA family ATPase [Actinomycetota bacterium]